MGLVDGYELKKGTGWQAAIQAAPAILAGVQASQANRAYGERMQDIENFRRQDLENPFANMSNPYENLAVATRGAEIQMEQTDQALATTLDTLRSTGASAGGATALANAALKSKQGVAASIEKQEVNNAELRAKGQQQINFAKAQGQQEIMKIQEKRDVADLDRLQSQADTAQFTRNQAIDTGIAALGSAGQTLAGGLVPNKIPTQEESRLASSMQGLRNNKKSRSLVGNVDQQILGSLNDLNVNEIDYDPLEEINTTDGTQDSDYGTIEAGGNDINLNIS